MRNQNFRGVGINYIRREIETLKERERERRKERRKGREVKKDGDFFRKCRGIIILKS